MMHVVPAAIAYTRHIRAATEIDVQASPEFSIFARWFIQDIDTIATNLDEMYNFSLKHFRGEERIRLRKFIDRVLSDLTDDDLQSLWDATDADIGFPTALDLRNFLIGARDRLR